MKKKMDLTKDSPEIAQVKLESFKKLFPEAISEGKIDVEALRRTIGENVAATDERYTLNWAGKTEAFKALQTPTTATLAPCQAESVDFEKTGNVFIEGENLEVLKVLQKAYYGKIKMIYIDPPYNTGSDSFIYPDRFQETKDEYLKRIEEKDEEGYLLKEGLFQKNSKEGGHYHSNWMSMMYPRLFLARNLLRDDGVIFVSINDNEVHNLRLLLNEIFGEENFVACFVWQSKKGGGSDAGTVVEDHEYVFAYAKAQNASGLSKITITAEELDRTDKKGSYRRGRELNKWGANSRREDRPTMWFSIPGPNGVAVFPIRNDGEEGCWRWGKKEMMAISQSEDVEFVKRDNGTYIVYEKIRSTDPRFKPYRTFLTDTKTTADGSKDIKSLFDDKKIFDFAKPKELLKTMIEIGSPNDDDIVLDFFAGSGTTAHAVLDMNKGNANRNFILAQLPELCAEDSEASKAGYKTIAEIGKERIRRVIKKIKADGKNNPDLFSKDKSDMDLGFKVFKLKSSNFKIWRGDVVDTTEDLEKQLDMLKDPVKPEALEQNLLWELMLKSGYDLNTPIEEQKIEKCKFYVIAGGEMAVIVSTADAKCLQAIIKRKPQKVVCLDSVFEGNDQLKTNTVLQMKDAEIEFRTI